MVFIAVIAFSEGLVCVAIMPKKMRLKGCGAGLEVLRTGKAVKPHYARAL